MMRFVDKVAIVTGGSQGIGARIAERLGLEGAFVAVLSSSNLDKADAVAERIREAGGRANGYAIDVRDRASVQALVEKLTTEHGRIDLLVNAAGVFFPTPVGNTAGDQVDRMVDINLKGTFHAINAVTPNMIAAGSGKIVNIASVAATMGIGGYALYCATKAGITQMTRAMACELAPHGININAVAPGNTRTPINEDIRTNPSLKPMLDAMASRTPSGNVFTDPDDIAGLALYLLSPDARAIHGTTVLMDEGFSAGL
jgi:3-oxoacyl-[acyl-carrier protein] reductase